MTPNKLPGPIATSSQPVGSTQRALQASLSSNIVFANESIVDAIFPPSKVDNRTVIEILGEMNDDKHLKAARDSVIHGELAAIGKNQLLVRH